MPELCRSLRSTRILLSNTYLSFLEKLVHRSVLRVVVGGLGRAKRAGV